MMNGRDCWVEAYLAFLKREHGRLSGGAIGRHYIHCASGSYQEWKASRHPQARFAAWLAIRCCAQWLSQLEQGSESNKRKTSSETRTR
jgi:hypothetical protein